MIVPVTERKSEPRQPKRLEKKANIHAISRWKRSDAAAVSLCRPTSDHRRFGFLAFLFRRNFSIGGSAFQYLSFRA